MCRTIALALVVLSSGLAHAEKIKLDTGFKKIPGPSRYVWEDGKGISHHVVGLNAKTGQRLSVNLWQPRTADGRFGKAKITEKILITRDGRDIDLLRGWAGGADGPK